MANEKLEAGIVTLGKIELVSILPQYLKSFGVEVQQIFSLLQILKVVKVVEWTKQ